MTNEEIISLARGTIQNGRDLVDVMNNADHECGLPLIALKRTAESLARVGVPLATIDAQIRLISLMTRRQMWSCRPGGAA